MFPKDITLPSDEELQTEEITMSSIALKAGAVFCGKFCDYEFKEFMLCRNEVRDPRKCLKEGKDATNCGLQFYRLVKEGCYEQFEKYWRCLDIAGPEQKLVRCRKTQRSFDACVKDKIGLDRPPLGFFSSVRIHDSKRPVPRKVPIRDYQKLDSLPADFVGVDPNQAMPSTSGYVNVNRAS